MRDLYTQGLLDNGCELEPNEPGGVFFLACIWGSTPAMGNRGKPGKCGPAPTRKSQWGARFSRQNPRPQIGSPLVNQACILRRLL